jgi:CO dehydrogenase/acetyl-CoA synthase epsilon subunit
MKAPLKGWQYANSILQKLEHTDNMLFCKVVISNPFNAQKSAVLAPTLWQGRLGAGQWDKVVLIGLITNYVGFICQ